MKVLITTSSFDIKAAAPLRALESAGAEIVLNPHGRKLSEDEAVALYGKHDPAGVIAGTEPVTSRVLDAAPSLRVLARLGVGVDSVDEAALENRGISLSITPDGPVAAVSELALGLMLSALRRIPQADRTVRAEGWNKMMGGLLAARTVGIVGAGRIGRRTAELVRAFGAATIASDPVAQSTEDLSVVPLQDLLESADIVSLHAPALPETENLIGAEALSKMKPGAILISIARGELVDEAALLDALTGGRLAGAALDVYREEPYRGPLAKLDNVVLTTHMGSYAAEARSMMETQAAENLVSGLKARGAF